jgi:Ca2+-binding RTX toxin-like protein
LKKREQHRVLKLESLETRSLMAADIVLGNDGVLRVTGSTGNDTIMVKEVGWGTVQVSIADSNSGAILRTASFDDGVQLLEINGDFGNDVITNASALPSTIRGGDGQDTITGGSNEDRIFGDAGTDYLYGEGGNDYLDGGVGTDYVRGGAGSDKVLGGNDSVVDYLWGDAGADDFRRKTFDRLMDYNPLEKDYDPNAK